MANILLDYKTWGTLFALSSLIDVLFFLSIIGASFDLIGVPVTLICMFCFIATYLAQNVFHVYQ